MIERETTLSPESKQEISPTYFLKNIKNEAAEKLSLGEERETIENNIQDTLVSCNRYIETALALSRIAAQTQYREGGVDRVNRAHQREHLAHQVLCDQITILARVCKKSGLSINWYEQFLGPGGKIDRDKVGEWGFLVFQEQNRKFDAGAI